MKVAAAIALVACLLVVAPTCAADVTIEAAKEAYNNEAARIDEALASAKKLAEERRTKARQKLLKAYDDAIKRTTQRGDLVAANTLLDEKRALEDGGSPEKGSELEATGSKAKVIRVPLAAAMNNLPAWRYFLDAVDTNCPMVVDGVLSTQKDIPPGQDLDIAMKKPIMVSAIMFVTREKGSGQDIFTKARILINESEFEVVDVPQETCLIIAFPQKVRLQKIKWITEQQAMAPGFREVMFQ